MSTSAPSKSVPAELTAEQKKAAKLARKAQRKAEKEAEKAARPAPVPFRKSADSAILNADGLLTISDPQAHGYSEETHEALEREDFASESLWLTFRAGQLRLRAAALIAKADQMERDAANAANFGDPTKRKQVKQVAKLAGALAALRATLEKEGVDVSAILANLEGPKG